MPSVESPSRSIPTTVQVLCSPDLIESVDGCGDMRGERRNAASSLSVIALDAAVSLLSGVEVDASPCGTGFGLLNGSVGPVPGGGANPEGCVTGTLPSLSGTACASLLPGRLNCWRLAAVGVNGSIVLCDSMRGVTPRNVRLFVVPTHIGATSSSVIS